MSKRRIMKEFREMAEEMLRWYGELSAVSLEELIPNDETARRTAVFSADMINAFCKKGALSSPRIDMISRRVAELFSVLHSVGVEKFVLVQEWHHERAKEFISYPIHGIAGTLEAETISELADLPFADKFVIFRKNALSPAWSYRQIRHNPQPYTNPIYPKSFEPVWRESFGKYLEGLDINMAIVVGNCTDLCVRELAMHLKMWANENQRDLRVIIPEFQVETFDLPMETAKEIQVMPHPGDMCHIFALYEMARNGIEIVKKIS